MALAPSSFRLRKGEKINVEEVAQGMFTVTNAYEGEYEYFDNEPIALAEDSSESEISSSTA
jgi:hypothetical protein